MKTIHLVQLEFEQVLWCASIVGCQQLFVYIYIYTICTPMIRDCIYIYVVFDATVFVWSSLSIQPGNET